MANELSVRALTRLQPQSSGLTQAKKMADLYIKTHTDDNGRVTSPDVYTYAINTYLAPFAGNVDADRKIAEYVNASKKISAKQVAQEDTLASFKRRELDAWWNDVDGEVGFRDPAVLSLNTSQALDAVLLEVLNTIDERAAMGESVDSLITYADTLAQRADAMRDLSNKLFNGELPAEALNGYGYYIDASPIDGSVRGASIMPVGLAPDDLAKGMRRVNTSARVGSAELPLYLPAVRDEYGNYVAKMGDTIWNGVGEGALQKGSGSIETNNFNEVFKNGITVPKASTGLRKGEFGRIPLGGRDESGRPIETIVYKGMDDKIYTVTDPDTLASIQADPFLGRKLGDYVTRLSPIEAEEVRTTAQPFSLELVGKESRATKIQVLQSEAAKAEEDYKKITGSFSYKAANTILPVTDAIGGAVKGAFGKVASFFGRKNSDVQPEQAPAARGGQYNSPDVVEQGASIFRSQ
jgi:hypothetical protein